MRNRGVGRGAWGVGLVLVLPSVLLGQSKASEHGSVSQTIGGTVITVEYNRPSVRSRDSLFGRQIPWGHIWTPGANNVTTLATNRSIKLNGQRVAAGKYGLWMEVRRDSSWILHLHRDTTKWHLPPPRRDSMLMSIPVEHRTIDTFRETLAWEFERVRVTGAELRMHWDRTMVTIDLALDSGGVTTTVAEAESRPYLGRFLQTSARDSTRHVRLTVRYDAAHQSLLAEDDTNDWPDTTGGAHWGYILLPRAEGIFALGYAINGELVQLPNQPSMIEFTVSGSSASGYVRRDAQDRITSRGVRDQ